MMKSKIWLAICNFFGYDWESNFSLAEDRYYAGNRDLLPESNNIITQYFNDVAEFYLAACVYDMEISVWGCAKIILQGKI